MQHEHTIKTENENQPFEQSMPINNDNTPKKKRRDMHVAAWYFDYKLNRGLMDASS